MDLASATWADVAACEADLALLPVGSTEQHGPHAPLGTDTLAARTVASAGADAVDAEVLVAPAVPVGIAEEHADFEGTLWVRPETFRAYVREVIESLVAQGVQRVVVVNGHGGNVAALREVCAAVTRDGAGYAVPFTWFDAVDAPDMGHGGPVETSLLLATHPDLVDEDECERAAVTGADEWGEWASGTNLAYDASEFTESGAVGDPREADTERGEALLAEAGEALATLIERVRERAD